MVRVERSHEVRPASMMPQRLAAEDASGREYHHRLGVASMMPQRLAAEDDRAVAYARRRSRRFNDAAAISCGRPVPVLRGRTMVFVLQ